MERTAEIPGVQIKLGGKEFSLPAMPLIKMSTVGKLMEGSDPMKDEGYVQCLADALYYSLRRNYKSITKEFVEENLDTIGFQPILNAFMQANGFLKGSDEGEAAASQ